MKNSPLPVSSSSFKVPPLSEPIDHVFDFLMKLYFYLGFTGYLPYFLIQSLRFFPLNGNTNTLTIIVIIIGGELLIFFLMDIFGMQSNFLDRISRLIPLIMVLLGAIAMIWQFILITSSGWVAAYFMILFLGIFNLLTFGILGWFFIRQEYGLTRQNLSPSMHDSMICLLISGILFFFEFFLPGALFIGISISFVAYPFIIMIWGRPKVIPQVKSRKLINPYKRATFSNFIIDMIKASAILITILVVLYDGSAILYPIDSVNGDLAWLRNLAIVSFFAALGMYLYSKFGYRFHGLFTTFLLYLLTLAHFIIVIVFDLHVWWVIAPINGFTLAGVYFFIEQKIFKSENVRIMSGSYYTLIFLIIVVAILLRVDPETDKLIDYGRLLVSSVGIAYLMGYIRDAPNTNLISSQS
ncbi:MAG: hypothetical protein E4G98_00040 [Promethearchaeota archaeon]|nr:MAG: hypothetical protein E4G98_00040 [Candidatus Lokiarchaeota archaeon]